MNFGIAKLAALSLGTIEMWAYPIIAFAAVLGFAAPFVSARVLSAKMRERHSFFERRVREYAEFCDKEHRAPALTQGVERYEADLARWASSVVGQAVALKLEKGQVCTLVDAGVLKRSDERIKAILAGSCDDGSVDAGFDFRPKGWMCGLTAALVCADSLVLAALGANPVVLALGCLLAFALCLCTICDLKTMTIPYQIAYAIYPLALAIAINAQWPNVAGSLIGGIAFLVVLQLIFSMLNKVLAWRGRPKGVSAGDMRLIPAIALAGGGAGTVVGFVAMAVVMAFYAGTLMIFKGRGLKSYVPMAPGLFAWAVVGVAVNAGLGSFAG